MGKYRYHFYYEAGFQFPLDALITIVDRDLSIDGMIPVLMDVYRPFIDRDSLCSKLIKLVITRLVLSYARKMGIKESLIDQIPIVDIQ